PFLRIGTAPAPIISSSRSPSSSPTCAGVTCQCANLDRNLASAGVVSLGGSGGASALSTPLAKGSGGRPRSYREESLLLIALLKTLWRLSSQDVHAWLESWPALALACGLPLRADGTPALLNCANAGKQQELLPLKRSSCSRSGVPCAAV